MIDFIWIHNETEQGIMQSNKLYFSEEILKGHEQEVVRFHGLDLWRSLKSTPPVVIESNEIIPKGRYCNDTLDTWCPFLASDYCFLAHGACRTESRMTDYFHRQIKRDFCRVGKFGGKHVSEFNQIKIL